MNKTAVAEQRRRPWRVATRIFGSLFWDHYLDYETREEAERDLAEHIRPWSGWCNDRQWRIEHWNGEAWEPVDGGVQG